jgi:hypothetical protein
VKGFIIACAHHLKWLLQLLQEAFALSDDEAAAAPNGYIVKLKGGGASYNVYVHR